MKRAFEAVVRFLKEVSIQLYNRYLGIRLRVNPIKRIKPVGKKVLVICDNLCSGREELDQWQKDLKMYESLGIETDFICVGEPPQVDFEFISVSFDNLGFWGSRCTERFHALLDKEYRFCICSISEKHSYAYFLYRFFKFQYLVFIEPFKESNNADISLKTSEENVTLSSQIRYLVKLLFAMSSFSKKGS